MSLRRQPPTRSAPDLQPHRSKPAVSGEYRIVEEPRRRSSTTMNAVRPEVRRASSTSMSAVTTATATATTATATTATNATTGPRRYATVQMNVVAPPLSAGRELDDFDFDFDIDADGALELDSRPSSHFTREETSRLPTSDGAPPARRTTSTSMRRVTPPPMARVTPPPMARVTPPPMARVTPPPMARVTPPPTGAVMPRRRSSSSMAAVDPHAALVAFSGFGDPPPSVFGAPAYAVRVIARRRTLRRELKLARLRQSHDVAIYEASLRTADDGAVRNGILLTGAFFTMMTVLAWTAFRLFGGALVIPW